MAASFDTLSAARRLKEAGASEAVAEAIAETIREAREFDLSQLATKADLAALHVDMMALRSDLEAKIAATELRLLKWMIGVGIAAFVTITGTLSGVIWAATQVVLHAHA
jgi:hypothetical protein